MLSLFPPKEKDAKWQIIHSHLKRTSSQQIVDISNFHEFLEQVFKQHGNNKDNKRRMLF